VIAYLPWSARQGLVLRRISGRLGVRLIGLGGFKQGKKHGAGVSTLGTSGEEPVLLPRSTVVGVLGRLLLIPRN